MDFDLLVVGAGAGGLMTAARLASLGYRTLVAERLGHLGGRASTRDVDGFKINNGAIVIETGGIIEQTFVEVGGFDRARILFTVVTRDDWPPQRAVAGSDLPPGTPVANLWNVGDGVKEYANGGITACAETAQIVARQVAERYPAGLTPRP